MKNLPAGIRLQRFNDKCRSWSAVLRKLPGVGERHADLGRAKPPSPIACLSPPPCRACAHGDHKAMDDRDENEEILNELDLMNDVGDAVYNLALVGMVGGPRTAARIADDLCGQVEEAVKLMGKVPASRAQLAAVLVKHVKVLTAMTQGWAADE
jgi:hypothetical protein